MVHQLEYKITLREPAVFSQIGGDPNRVESEGFVPGSAIWGALAGLIIQKRQLGNNARTDTDFKHWFLRDGLRCLNAYPIDENESDRRLLPVPLSIQKQKNNEFSLHDVIVYEPNEVQLKSEDGFCRLNDDGKKLYKKSSTTRFNYHTTRSSNRSMGRAVKADGGVFVYEALEAGQTFRGLILGEKKDLEQLQEDLGWTKKDSPLKLRLGRSRSTQYGGAAELELISPEPAEFKSEIAEKRVDAEDTDFLVLTLTSHLLLRDNSGYPAHIEEGQEGLNFPVKQLAEALGIDTKELKLEKCYARRELVGGYSAIWKLPRQQWPAFKAGSVFVFSRPKNITNLEAVEEKSLGLRTGEGYGRFVLDWHGTSKNLTSEKIEKTNNNSRPTTEIPETFKKLVKEITAKEFRRQAESKGRDDSLRFIDKGEKDGTFRFITAALLGRLQQALHNNQKSDDMKGWLNGLRQPARRQLDKVRDKNNRSLSLFTHITKILGATSAYEFVPDAYEVVKDVIDAIGWKPESELDLLHEAKQLYLLALTGEMSRKKRQQENDNG